MKLELKKSSTRSARLGEHKKHLSLKSEHDEKKIPEKKLYPAKKSMRKICSSEEEHEIHNWGGQEKFVTEEHETLKRKICI